MYLTQSLGEVSEIYLIFFRTSPNVGMSKFLNPLQNIAFLVVSIAILDDKIRQYNFLGPKS